MSIFSNESKLLIENWEAVMDINNARQRMAKELTNFLYSIENDLINTSWWQKNWDFNKQSQSEIYISRRDWKLNNEYAIWVGVTGFIPDSIFGDEGNAYLYVWVSKKNFELINMLKQQISEREADHLGEIILKASNQYVVTQEVKQFLPEELDDFENTVKDQILIFLEYYANLLSVYDKQIKSLLE